jgi:dTDP-4-amino-4,6-dideoxygalactose transaminase
MIPGFELKTQYQKIRSEVEEAVLRVLSSTHYILGPEVEAFEAEFAAWHGARHAIGVGSGTEALHLALRAFDIGPGDEVICPPFTYMATAGAIAQTGARPVFADVELDTYGLDPARVAEAVTPRTRAMVVVHLFGHPAPMGPLLDIARRHNLVVIEDCAQATGAQVGDDKVGTLGDVGCFSFYPTKNLGGVGDGGMLLARDPEVARKLRMLRAHGQGGQKYYHEILGTNSRLDEIQAAVLRVKLRHLDEWNALRREAARSYGQKLAGKGLALPVEAPGCRHVYHQYTVRCPHRALLIEHLRQQGVGCTVYYPLSLHLQPLFAHLGGKRGDFPRSEEAQDQVLSLPMYPELTEEQIDQVAAAVGSFAAQATAAG